MKDEISAMKYELETEKSKYDAETIADTKATIEIYEIALENNINFMYTYSYNWKIQLLEEIQSAKTEIYLDEAYKEAKEKSIDERITLLKNDDYSGYIELLKKDENIKLHDKIITQEEYDDNIYLLNLKQKYGIYKDESITTGWKETTYEDIKTIKQDLRTGMNAISGKILKADEISKLEDSLKIDEYRLENNVPAVVSMSSARETYDIFAPAFSMLIVALLMIMIAGSSISTEISKGTIKFLLFTPNKRWKILLAKIISAVLILIIVTVCLSLLSVVIGNIFFEEAGTEYVYIRNGEVSSLPNLTYMLLYFLASGIDILVYLFFAFMLSVVTRNTALSVGVSIGCYVGSGIIMNLINYYFTADWVKFIPFNNLEMADRIFSNNLSYSSIQMVGQSVSGIMNTNIVFSLAVLGTYVLLMIVTMFDSFNKRDIV